MAQRVTRLCAVADATACENKNVHALRMRCLMLTSLEPAHMEAQRMPRRWLPVQTTRTAAPVEWAGHRAGDQP